MNALDKFIAYLSPAAGARRMANRMKIDAYAAAFDSRLRKFKRQNGGPNTAIRGQAAPIRRTARQFEEDSDIAKRALDLLEQNIIGTGVIPEPTARTPEGKSAADFNRLVARKLRDWRRRPEATHRMSDGTAKRLAFRSFARDGEVLIQHLRGNVSNFRHASPLPYSYELIEADRLPFDFDNQTGGSAIGGTIVQGIALNAWGEPQAYFLHPQNPDESRTPVALDFKNLLRKPKADIIHVAAIKRIAQLRGVSQFATVMSRLEDVTEVDEAERVAVRIAASIGLAVYDDARRGPSASATDAEREVDWHPGMILNLGSDSRAEVLESKRPTESLLPWRKSQLQALAGGVGVTGSALMLDYMGSYSSQRQELVEGASSYGVIWSYWVDTVEEPMYREALALLLRTDAEVSKLAKGVDDATLFDAEFSRPVMPWVDPDKEAKALTTQYELGIKTKADMIRERGGIPEEVIEGVADEKRAAAELALEIAPPVDPNAEPGAAEPKKPAPKPGQKPKPKEAA
jgi:lambda family phage portal protein